MSKTGDTKKRIVELLEQKNETLTELSNKLDLAPSTVSQHLQELVDSGDIRLVNDRPRKWKYYEINKSKTEQPYRGPFDIKRVVAPIAAIAIIVVIAFILFGSKSTSAGSLQQVYIAPGSAVPIGSTVFSVSDAPSLYNISALVVTVDNASIRSASTGKWYNVPLQANSFDLIELKNISSILSGVKLQSGIYDGLVLDISNVTATVNGTTENVILPNHKIYIIGYFNISNNSTNWINLDFDLSHSLHILANGSIAMLPVINVRHVNDSDLELNQSYIIIARGPGRVKAYEEYGMNENGSMVGNFCAPQNITLVATTEGRFRQGGIGITPIIVSTRHGLIIGGDAGNLINLSVNRFNWTAQPNITVNSSEASIIKVCPMAMPVIGGAANVNSSAVNASVIVTGPRRAVRCCYPIYMRFESGSAAAIRRCIVVGMPVVAGNAVPARFPGGYVNISASGLNNGIYENGWINGLNESQINVSLPNGIAGNVNAHCTLQNGALSCASNAAENPRGVAIGIWGLGTHGIVRVSANSSAGSNGGSGGLAGGLIIRVNQS